MQNHNYTTEIASALQDLAQRIEDAKASHQAKYNNK